MALNRSYPRLCLARRLPPDVAGVVRAGALQWADVAEHLAGARGGQAEDRVRRGLRSGSHTNRNPLRTGFVDSEAPVATAAGAFAHVTSGRDVVAPTFPASS